MFTTIMVPLDGSPLAERSLPYAEMLARASGGTLALVRAVTAGITGSRVTVIHEALAYLERIAADLRSRGLTVQTSAPYGQPASGVVAMAGQLGADLIVLATHGRSGMSHLAYGSVAEEILTRARAPILLISARGEAASEPFAAGAPLLAPLDGSGFAERSLPTVRELAALLGTGVVLVQALGDPEAFGQPISPSTWAAIAEGWQEQEVAAVDYLREIARQELPGIETVCVARTGSTTAVVADVTRDYGAALVVMATHGRFGLSRFFFGNVADDAMHAVGAPCLLVGPQARGAVLTNGAALADIAQG